MTPLLSSPLYTTGHSRSPLLFPSFAHRTYSINHRPQTVHSTSLMTSVCVKHLQKKALLLLMKGPLLLTIMDACAAVPYKYADSCRGDEPWPLRRQWLLTARFWRKTAREYVSFDGADDFKRAKNVNWWRMISVNWVCNCLVNNM